MKKIIALLLGLGFVFSTCAFADEIKQVTSETILYIKAVHTLPENALNNFSVFSTSSASEKQEQLVSFLKSCQPYNENINMNFFGFDATLNIHSNGKINQKCSYEISANINKIPENVTLVQGLSAEDLIGLNPKLSCEFTQEQLDGLVYMVSEVFSEVKANNPNSKQRLKSKLASDERIKALFKDNKACVLTGLTDSHL